MNQMKKMVSKWWKNDDIQTLNKHFRTPVLVSLYFQYYTRKIPEQNLYCLISYSFLDVTMPPTEIVGDLNLIS
jgi:hypothetical protein